MAREGDAQRDRDLEHELSSRDEDVKGYAEDKGRDVLGSTNEKNEEGEQIARSQGSRSPADVQVPSHTLRGHHAQSTPAIHSPYTGSNATDGSMPARKQSFPNIRVLQSVPTPTSSPTHKEYGHMPPTGRFATFPEVKQRRYSLESERDDWVPGDEIAKLSSTLPRKPQSSVEPEYEVGSVMWKLRTEPNKSSAQRKSSIMSATIEVFST
jgi:hypothetical protein